MLEDGWILLGKQDRSTDALGSNCDGQRVVREIYNL